MFNDLWRSPYTECRRGFYVGQKVYSAKPSHMPFIIDRIWTKPGTRKRSVIGTRLFGIPAFERHLHWRGNFATPRKPGIIRSNSI